MVKSVRATDFTLGNVTAVATTRAGPALGTYCRSAWRSEIEHIAVLRVAVERHVCVATLWRSASPLEISIDPDQVSHAAVKCA